jgi:tetratricopeptide (TPR) repeat protein
MNFVVFTGYLFLQAITPEIIAHAQAGVAAQEQGKLDVAIEEFRKVIELQPESVSGHANLGQAYFQKGDYSASIPELEHALRLNPNLMGSHQTLGVALLVEGNPEAALPHLEKTRMPELLGVAYLETGRLGSAVMALKAALDRKPDDPDLLYYFGTAAAAASRQTARRLAVLKPDWAREDGAANNGNQAAADIVELQKQVASQPDDVNTVAAFTRAAEVASKQAFDRVARSGADSARAHQVLAERHVATGQLAEAIQEYTEALHLKPYAAHVHFALGNVFLAQGNASAAAAQFRMESQLRPLSADAFYSLGSVLLQLGQPAKAVEELSHADRLKRDSPPILLALGRAALAANDTGRAEATWLKLLEVDHQSPLAAAAHLELSVLYRRAGRTQEADREKTAYEELKKLRGP